VRAIEERVRSAVRSCGKHPAVLCYAIGNEIPSSIVRWHGRSAVERFIKRLFDVAKSEDPEGIVTYVNFPPTEYLQLDFLDALCVNVYLETRPELESYLARLHNIAGDRPLLLAEVGLDSRRNGEETQAQVLEWQIRTAFAGGCAGAIIFAWTDEWYRGGYDIEDWDFGLTRRDRTPKPALNAVMQAFTEVPPLMNGQSLRISVVVCAHNAESTIHETLEACSKLEYPNFEVIVVDDGSTDRTAAIAEKYAVRLIRIANKGLSNARNVGAEAATGEIVAFIDADAYPDPHWLMYLARTFAQSDHAGVGGPNIIPSSDGFIAQCVARAPGGPIHVLYSDHEAEHIPGCNMAFRKRWLEEIGGFDPQFHAAGDDVDLCWRLQERGLTLGFSPAAVVWHHRRNSLRAFWKQQKGYGAAEALLEKKWPQKYNRLGHLSWGGRLYGSGNIASLLFQRRRVYHGTWGTGLFQSIYDRAPGHVLSFPLIPEWLLVVAALGVLSALSLLWSPLYAAIPLFVIALGLPLVQAANAASRASLKTIGESVTRRFRSRLLIGVLHIIQPLARLIGRTTNGLTPWRRHRAECYAFPRKQTRSIWFETRRSAEQILMTLQSHLRATAAVVVPGGAFDRWDLEIRVGTTGAVRVLLAVEDHEGGKQLLKFRSWPVASGKRLAVTASLNLIAIVALLDGARVAAAVLGAAAVALGIVAFLDCATAASALRRALTRLEKGEC
jgi:glycosyltransferase involved in cell wall biosynthesis